MQLESYVAIDKVVIYPIYISFSTYYAQNNPYLPRHGLPLIVTLQTKIAKISFCFPLIRELLACDKPSDHLHPFELFFIGMTNNFFRKSLHLLHRFQIILYTQHPQCFSVVGETSQCPDSTVNRIKGTMGIKKSKRQKPIPNKHI